jgi:hypothetical protein
MHNDRGFDRMGASDPPAIALEMAARASVIMSGTADPRAIRASMATPRPNKMGSQTRDPITQVWND